MNDIRRQLLLLVSLMVFLSSVTVFLVDTTAEVDYKDSSENSSSNESISVDFEKEEGEGLYAQAVNGWIMLTDDVLTGFDVIDSNLEDQSDS